MGGHQSARANTVVWFTPPEILQELGPFDLDPCTMQTRPFDTAKKHVCYPENGLEILWHGRVWLNPPYGLETGKWLRKLAAHENGTAIIFARTDTRMFFEEVWEKASGILFIKGRIHFLRADGERAKANSGAPSCLVAYGEDDSEILRTCGIEGKFIKNV